MTTLVGILLLAPPLKQTMERTELTPPKTLTMVVVLVVESELVLTVAPFLWMRTKSVVSVPGIPRLLVTVPLNLVRVLPVYVGVLVVGVVLVVARVT